MITITLNGENKELDNNCNIADLINKFDLDIEKIAIEKNLEIINKIDYKSTKIDEGDNIEIVHFIGGG